MEDLYRHHFVIQARWTVFSMFSQCKFSCGRGRSMSLRILVLQVLHPESRRSSTGDAFLCVAAVPTVEPRPPRLKTHEHEKNAL